MLPLRVAGDDLHSVLDGPQLGSDAHDDMAFYELRVALGVVADEVERRACAAGCGIHAVSAVLKKLAQEHFGAVADAGDFGTSDAGLGQDLANGGRGQVVEAIVLGRGAVPVADIGLVPHLPQPGCSLVAVAVAQVGRVGLNQPRPTGLVLGRIRPAGEDFALGEAVAIRLRVGGERLGHEADLDQRTDMRFDQRVEYAVGEGEVVDRRSIRPLGVDVGRAPLQRALAVAGGEQVMRTKIDRNGAERSQFAEQLFAVRGVKKVRLIGAEEVPNGGVGAGRLAGMNLNRDRAFKLRLDPGACLREERGQGWKKRSQKRDARPSKRLLHALHDTISGRLRAVTQGISALKNSEAVKR